MSHPIHRSIFSLVYSLTSPLFFFTFSCTFQLLVLPFSPSEYTTILFPLILAFFSFSFFFSILFHFQFHFLFTLIFCFIFTFIFISDFFQFYFKLIYLFHGYFHIFRMFSKNVRSRHRMDSIQSRCRIYPFPLYW